MNIRTINQNDYESFFKLCRKLDQEAQFTLVEPFENASTIEEQTRSLDRYLSFMDRALFVVEMDDQLVGYLGARKGRFIRNNHVARIELAILYDYAGRGIGKHLFDTLESWAEEQQIHRLELSTMQTNQMAINLYTLMGFQFEGSRYDSIKMDKGYVNEYCLAKLLD